MPEPLTQQLDLVKGGRSACDEFGRRPQQPILIALCFAVEELMGQEGLLPITVDWDHVDRHVDEAVYLRTLLRSQKRFLGDLDYKLGLWRYKLMVTFAGLFGYLPESCFTDSDLGEGGLEASVIDLMEEPAVALERLAVTFSDADVIDAQVFELLREQLYRNTAVASGIHPDEIFSSKKEFVLPTGQKGLTASEAAEAYCRSTAFKDFFETRVPLALPSEIRFEHTHILGGTGHGKTQLMQQMILADLEAACDERRSVMVIDSQGDLINKLSRLNLFAPGEPLANKLVLVDPTDIEFPPSLNMFDSHLDRLSDYAPVDRERVLNGAIELYEHFFGALLGAELTQKQGVIFRYLARLMIQIPGANIHTLIQLMEDAKPYKQHMEALEGSARHFFETEFSHPSFGATKKQILRRLWGVLSTPAFERMFAQKENKIDLYQALQDGSVVLVNTAKELLKSDGSSILGRFFIALASQAALERSVLDEDARTPTMLYVDEAHEYFDDNIEAILNQARKYRVGMTLAHQNLGQLSNALRASVMASTSIKIAGGVSAKDAQAVAPDMLASADFLKSMRKRGGGTEFAFYAKGLTHSALRLSVAFGRLETQERMSDEAFEEVRAEVRARFCVPWDGASMPWQARAPDADDLAEPADETPPAPEAPAKEPAPVKQASEPVPPPVETKKQEKPEAPVTQASQPAQGRGGSEHRYLQELIRRIAQDRNLMAVVEGPLEGGGRADVLVGNEDRRVAFEISVTTDGDQELGNLAKYGSDEVAEIVVVSANARHLASLRQRASKADLDFDLERISFLAPADLLAFFDSFVVEGEVSGRRVRGYEVQVSHRVTDQEDARRRRDAVGNVIARSINKTKD